MNSCNYVDIWTQIPLLTFVKNTVKITVVVTLLQLFTSSFAAYAFAKMQFKGCLLYTSRCV